MVAMNNDQDSSFDHIPNPYQRLGRPSSGSQDQGTPNQNQVAGDANGAATPVGINETTELFDTSTSAAETSASGDGATGSQSMPSTGQYPMTSSGFNAPQGGQALFGAENMGAASANTHQSQVGALPTVGSPSSSGVPTDGSSSGEPPIGGVPTGIAPMGDPEYPKQKRTVGVGTALTLMLAAAIGAGGVTGFVVGHERNSGGTVVNALNQPQAHRNANASEREGGVEQVASTVLPSVVSIEVSSITASEGGSGSIISSDGYVLTNNHVVANAERGGEIKVQLNNGTEYKADFIAGDGKSDIAVIKIRNAKDLPVIKFGDSNELAVGQKVLAIGSPLGLSATVTSGIISALNRPVRADGVDGGESSLIDAVQTDAAINPGNSGGPLVDMDGNLIGMNSVIASMGSSSSSGQSGSIGLGFAIPVNQAHRIAQQLIDEGKVTFPKLGITLDQKNRLRGALVNSVDQNQPAARAGIKDGDLIVGVNDRSLESNDALIAAVRSQNFGETIRLKVTRPGSNDVREVSVTLSEKE